MRILYLSRESPLFPAGGIGTYLSYAAEAMQQAGHEVFLFAWAEKPEDACFSNCSPFLRDNVHVQILDMEKVWRQYPNCSRDLGRSHALAQHVGRMVKEWKIDVIESADYLAPAMAFFQEFQSGCYNNSTLCVTYNHGFIEDFFEADRLRQPEESRLNCLSERQQCRISDLVVSPSNCARERLARYGISRNVKVIREPYFLSSGKLFEQARPELVYFGRISISKGIDNVILLANALHSVFELDSVKLIGKLVNTSFRQHDIKRYVRERLSPALRDAVLFTDFMPRRQALHQLVPGALSPNLGSAETFSYACVETIDHGLLPTVRHGTPMVEFFPEDMQQHILPSNLGAMRQIQSHMEKLIADGKGVTTRVREHCRETLHPVKIAEQMGKLYESELHKKRKRHTVQVKKNLRLEDITILIPAYSPGAEFAETVDSIVAQTAGVPKVIVCDDGSPENNAHWLEYARTQLPFCEIIKQPNGRLLSARLALLDACQTEAAIFLDADDLLGEQAISKLLEAWNNAPWSIDAVIPHRQNIGESNEAILRNYLDDHLHLLRNDFRMTSLIRTEVLRNISFDPSRRNGEADDWLFWLEFSLLGHRALMVPGNLFFYRFSTGSMSWPWSEGQHVGTQTMLRELFERYGKNSPDVANLMSRALFFLQTGG